MAIDNSLYDSLQNTYFKTKNYLDNTKLGPEHSQMMIKHEELADLLERLDIEAIEEQSKDIHTLHKELNHLKEYSDKIVEDIARDADSITISNNVVTSLEHIFSTINPMII